MRILWSSNAPWGQTGYGNQTALFAPRLASLGHEIALFGWWGLQGGILNYSLEHADQWRDFLVYPAYRDGYGNDLVSAHGENHRADLVISLIDAWVLDERRHGAASRWAPWFPIDHEPIPPAVLKKVAAAAAPIVYSRFGELMMHDAGLDCLYVPHGVDTAKLTPGDKREARARLGLHADEFVALMVAANKGTPSRKAFPQALEGFAGLARRHGDARLYLHTNLDTTAGGVALDDMIELYGIESRVTVANQYAIATGAHSTEHMRDLYRAADVLLCPSWGEGFGIPIVEAQACGCPVIVGDWTSMPELCFAGWKISRFDALPFLTPANAYQFIAHPGAIEESLEQAYQTSDERRDLLAEAARAGAMPYDADAVAAQYWRPALDEIARRLGVESAVPA